ncbi:MULTISPECIES: hypothetical protein [Pantoea]|uniref:hypothetical protein n=1 Tax=Pantoea TaxID=53335 RepID=UPI001231C111|nr:MULTISPECIES: hypothetical protein [Pantoea]KAA6093695.1 hypothetical protein F3I21_22880 [Pantoea sp. B_9]KAA6106029.1 hypothetical protein F3I18_24050 [Pantoea sp. B_10]KAA8667752.1 hypothetical protein F4W08_21490 [Pantoea dispersa]
MKILTIQYVCGLAALLVMTAHNAAFLGDYWENHIPGVLSVDVFFKVRGFIMTFITREAPDGAGAFLIKRFLHMASPSFWSGSPHLSLFILNGPAARCRVSFISAFRITAVSGRRLVTARSANPDPVL